MPYATRIALDVNISDAIEATEIMQVKMAHLELPLAEMAPRWSDHMLTLFETAPWPPLRPSTIAIKSAMGAPSDPLIRTGALRGFAGAGSSAAGGEWVIHGGAFGATAILEMPGYGRFHVTGFVHANDGFVPARDFTKLDEETIARMILDFGEYLAEGL